MSTSSLLDRSMNRAQWQLAVKVARIAWASQFKTDTETLCRIPGVALAYENLPFRYVPLSERQRAIKFARRRLGLRELTQ